MDISYYTVLLASLLILLVISAFIYVFLKDDYEHGYEDCQLHYMSERRLKLYSYPTSPYENGWNKAVEDIYNKM